MVPTARPAKSVFGGDRTELRRPRARVVRSCHVGAFVVDLAAEDNVHVSAVFDTDPPSGEVVVSALGKAGYDEPGHLGHPGLIHSLHADSPTVEIDRLDLVEARDIEVEKRLLRGRRCSRLRQLEWNLEGFGARMGIFVPRGWLDGSVSDLGRPNGCRRRVSAVLSSPAATTSTHRRQGEQKERSRGHGMG